MAEKSYEEEHPTKGFGWAARDQSGVLSPFKFSRRLFPLLHLVAALFNYGILFFFSSSSVYLDPFSSCFSKHQQAFSAAARWATSDIWQSFIFNMWNKFIESHVYSFTFLVILWLVNGDLIDYLPMNISHFHLRFMLSKQETPLATGLQERRMWDSRCSFVEYVTQTFIWPRMSGVLPRTL